MKVPGQQTSGLFQEQSVRILRVRYLLYLPGEYDAQPRRRWPLILFLHGSGERGARVSAVSAHGPPHIVKSRPDFPFIVLSPQCPRGQLWSAETLKALLEHIAREHRVDRRRIYLTGLSMGGYASWDLGIRHPELFAALAPVCGGGDILPILLAERQQLRVLRTLPVWAFHGAKDPVVPLAESERMVHALAKIGNKARLTIYPDHGHDCWTDTYGNPALYSWFLDHYR